MWDVSHHKLQGGNRMNHRIRPLLVMALVAVLALGLSIPSALAQQSRDTVVVGMAQEPDCLIMSFCQMAAGAAVANNSVFAGMVDYNDKWQPFPPPAGQMQTRKEGHGPPAPRGRTRVTYKFKRN